MKDDGSPVTQVDRETEALLRRMLLSQFPLDGIVGEEGSEVLSRSGRRWILDPIDGTRDYVRGTGRWAVLVALEEVGTATLLVGVVHFPAVGETFTATVGGGAYGNGARLKVSSVTSWHHAVVHINNLMLMNFAQYGPRLLGWLEGCLGVRNLGGAMDAVMVASGKADIWIDPVAKPWDLAPLKLLIEEAGGTFCATDGASTIYGGSAVAYTPALASAVRALLKGSLRSVTRRSDVTP